MLDIPIISIFYLIAWYYALLRILKKLYNVLYLLYKHYIRKGHDIKKRYGERSWVLVTGATDGIGKGFCIEFAKKGLNIILVSRTKSKLSKVSEELKEINANIKTQIVEFDFSSSTTIEKYNEAFLNIINTFDISILVNNVGTTTDKKFKYLENQSIQDMISINILPQSILSSMIIKKMIERNKLRKDLRSCIINLSSFASDLQVNKLIIYNAAKAFNSHHSKLLSYELNEFNIDSISVKPLWVETPLIKTRKTPVNITVQQCCQAVLQQVGFETETFGHIIHELAARFISSIPNVILRIVKVNNEWLD